MAAITYRPEVDGLRAVAVGVVVLFHAELGILSGGFTGVDVFFVISGFLITSIVMSELQGGQFSLLAFYERRIRRIFPALLVVVLACLLVGAWRMTPVDYKNLGQATMAALGFHSNFYFANKAGYFMPAAETLPLLHTWSLGVEEQFYLVAPLLLMLAWRAPRWLRSGATALVALALVVSLWGFARNDETAFYLPHTRAIELLIGVGLALGLVPALVSAMVRNGVAILGLGMIGAAAILYSSDTPFPGVAALLPCLGTALVIHGTAGLRNDTLVGRLLATTPMVALGKISYSLYLWHWPLFAFAAYEWGEVSIGARFGLIVASVLLATVTYLLIEQPARRSRTVLTRSRVFSTGLGAAGLLIVAGAFVAETGGWPQRLAPDVRAFVAKVTQRPESGARCSAQSLIPGGERCRIGDVLQSPSVLLWGDSHALAMTPQVHSVLRDLGRSASVIGRGGCPPLLAVGDEPQLRKSKCAAAAAGVTELLDTGAIRHVIITARWALYTPQKGEAGRAAEVDPALAGGAKLDAGTFLRLFEETLSRIKARNVRVTLIGPVPELPVHLPAEMTKAYMRSLPFDLRYDFRRFELRNASVLAMLERAEPAADVIYPHRLLCPGNVCAFIENGLPLYRDDNHLNLIGGDKLKPALVRALGWLDVAGTNARPGGSPPR